MKEQSDPIVRGGQGRSGESVTATALAVAFVLACALAMWLIGGCL